MGSVKKLLGVLLKSEFSKNVTSQIIGTGLAQALPFLVTPLLTRLYSEEEFALYTTFFAMASIFAVVVGGKYHTAIVLPRLKKRAIDIFWLSILLTAAYTAILFLAFYLFYDQLAKELNVLIYFIPFFVLFYGCWMSFVNLSIREKKFKTNAFAKVFQSIAYLVVAIGIGFSKLTYFGLVLARVAGVAFSSFFLFVKSGIQFKLSSLIRLKYVARKYIDYPKFGLIPALLNTISSQALILVIDRYYTRGDLGNFGLTYMVLAAPLALIGNSFRDVFYQKIAALLIQGRTKKAISFFLNCALVLLVIGLPICLTLVFFGSEIFKVIFGLKWERGGTFAAILAFAFYIKLVVSPLSSLFNASNTLRIASIWQTLYFFSTFLTLGLCAVLFQMKITDLMFVYVIHEIILYSLYFLLQYLTLSRTLYKKNISS